MDRTPTRRRFLAAALAGVASGVAPELVGRAGAADAAGATASAETAASRASESTASQSLPDANTGRRLFTATPSDDGGTWPIRPVEATVLGGEDLTRVFGFGRDDGEVYVLGSSMRDREDASSGGLYRLVPTT